jgi:uracil-DNA glycosylase
VDSLADRVAACERCGLSRTRGRAVAGDEQPGASVLVIAAAPSFSGEQVGRALSDEARDVLAKAGLDLVDVAATTLVKCRPPAGRAPTDEEIAACRPYLEEQVAAQQPATVIALGAAVLRALAPAAPPFAACHGHGRPGAIGDHELRLLPVLDPYAVAEVPSLAPQLAADLGTPPPSDPAPAAPAGEATPSPAETEPAAVPPPVAAAADEPPPQLGLF